MSAWRNSARVIHGPRGSLAQCAGRRLKKNASGSSADAELEQRQHALALVVADRRIVLGPQVLLGHVDRPGLQPQQFGVLVGHDVEHHAVEIRQRLARLVRGASSADCVRRSVAGRARRRPAGTVPCPRSRPAASSIGQACAKSPPASAASSRCLGRMTRLSSRRMPGPNGRGKVTTTVAASGVATAIGLPSTVRRNGQLRSWRRAPPPPAP